MVLYRNFCHLAVNIYPWKAFEWTAGIGFSCKHFHSFIPSFRFNMQRPSKWLCLLHRLGPCLGGTLKLVHRCASYLFPQNTSAYSGENVCKTLRFLSVNCNIMVRLKWNESTETLTPPYWSASGHVIQLLEWGGGGSSSNCRNLPHYGKTGALSSFKWRWHKPVKPLPLTNW